ncbi:MAG: outer membrane beta-barrel protein [Candidatus Aminicenantales bacterium]|jgi:opacity protein-like surface antigen
MKKTLVSLFVVFLFFAFAAATEAAIIKVKVQTANIRQQPDAQSAVISRATLGTMFEVVKKTGNWYEITAADATGKALTGYINADVVEEIGGTPSYAAPSAPAYTAPRASSGASAGTKPAGGLFIGAGLLMSNLSFDSETQSSLDQWGVKKKMKMGFQFGGGYEMALSPNISIMPGLFYSTAGANLDYTGSDNKSYTDSYSLSGVIIPIDVKISFNGPFVTVGPYIGYLFSAKYIPAVGESEDLFQADSSGNVYFNRLHFGVSLGAGIDLDLGGMVLMVKAGYQLGLSKLNKPYDSTDTFSMKHNAITILAAIKL